jgi:hypothetical protein
VTQRSIEIIIGRLLTDEEFRKQFSTDPRHALVQLIERGTHLAHAGIAARVAMDSALWERVGDQIDPRLQKPSLNNE